MPKLTNQARKLAEFSELKSLRRELARPNKLDSATLGAKNDRYHYLQAELVRKDTEIRKQRAEAHILAHTIVPKTFVPFDPKGSGYNDAVTGLVNNTLNSIAGSPSQSVAAGYGEGSGAVLGGGDAPGFNATPSAGFFSGLGDLANDTQKQTNATIAGAVNAEADADAELKAKQNRLLLGGAAAVGLYLYLKRRKG